MTYFLDYDLCCSLLFIRGFGDVLNAYPDSFGSYFRTGKFNNKTAYKLVDKEYYLFRSTNRHINAEDEVWMVI